MSESLISRLSLKNVYGRGPSVPPIVAPIAEDEWTNACTLYTLMPAERQRQFWQIRGNRADKLAFLLRWGRFEKKKGRT